jgi:hypothetical protein
MIQPCTKRGFLHDVLMLYGRAPEKGGRILQHPGRISFPLSVHGLHERVKFPFTGKPISIFEHLPSLF